MSNTKAPHSWGFLFVDKEGGYDQAEVLCPRWEEQTTPLPNHKSSILQDQASPKLIEWVNNYIVSHSTHMMHITLL